jgi:outer membrane protein OmpA-like peptidoglycan-associated protein
MRKGLPQILAGLLLFSPMTAPGQHGTNAWSLSVTGGVNYWLNDLATQKVGGGGELLLRHSFSRLFSLGLLAGYQDIKGEESPGVVGEGYGYGYLKLRAFNAGLQGYWYLSNRTSFTPYLYAGVGTMLYQRLDGQKQYVPNQDLNVSLLLPVGIGFEAFVSKKTAFTLDLSARGISDWADLKKVSGYEVYLAAMVGFTFYLAGGDEGDDDEDGLVNAQERALGTNSSNPDTDEDGLRDGEEVLQFRTSPVQQDTDGDGLTDGDEVYRYRTDPTKSDTDGDQLFDGEEIREHRTDPLRADTDADGLRDGQEVLRTRTDPLDPDTDRDGLTDGEEVLTSLTDPLRADTDGDGLTDAEEIRKHKTNPTRSDTDGGGVADGVEVRKGTNPLDPKDDSGPSPALKRGDRLVLEGVVFPDGSAVLGANADPGLKNALNLLMSNSSLIVEVAAHTDNAGDARSNEWLSLRRARAVVDWLVRNGVPSWRVTAAGYGSREPVASNATAEGRAKNRRVEFRVR